MRTGSGKYSGCFDWEGVRRLDILFDSKDESCKSPFGCLKEGEDCFLRLKIPRRCVCLEAEVFLKREDGFFRKISMSWASLQGSYDWWETNFSLDEAGLYFYHFHIVTAEGEFPLYRQGWNGTAVRQEEPWQLTCYGSDADFPAGFAGRIMYQIFPDRFCRGRAPDLTEKLTPFTVHEREEDLPCFLPDENGVVQNNDFFGGNLDGIRRRLPYLRSLGVGVLYLNPIFMAYSNHRYDTADYRRIDPMLGKEDDFSDLCREAHDLEMRVILDGVFSHTGSDSIYFDVKNRFGGGAFHHPDSPYRRWYRFRKDGSYESWWGIETLPCLEELDESFLDFLLYQPDSVVEHWLRLGADGFRLDVADELPDELIRRLRVRMKEIKPEALLLGEVWEDASNKISYGVRRRYLLGDELDAVMNYPFRGAILDFAGGQISGEELSRRVMTLAENYPKTVLDCSMNSLSTHDTPRVLSFLGTKGQHLSKDEQARHSLDGPQRREAMLLQRAAAFLQYVLPGCPCIYYGDEAGLEGLGDPFNRRFFPWQGADDSLAGYYVRLGQMKNSQPALRRGDIRFFPAGEGKSRVILRRRLEGEELWAAVNLEGPAFLKMRGDVLFSHGACFQERGRFSLSRGGVLLWKGGQGSFSRA